MKRIVLLAAAIIAAFFIVSCKTATFELPEFAPVIPTRPKLRAVSDLSVEAEENIRNLVIYALELEAYSAGWREFYDSLKSELKGE